ncbi:MAG: hypothetical protein E7Z63_05290 [Thermoplasmata archaeon]|nr:hypothetical protein [Thermoplasmata archaeon]
MDVRFGYLTIVLLVAGVILMPAGFYLMAKGGTSVLFIIGAVIISAAIAMAALRSYGFLMDAPKEVSQEDEGSGDSKEEEA